VQRGASFLFFNLIFVSISTVYPPKFGRTEMFFFFPNPLDEIYLPTRFLKMISVTRRIFFVFVSDFCHQYFDCLPPKIWSYRNVIFSPGILSMRSIFLQGFQGLKRFILMSFQRFNADFWIVFDIFFKKSSKSI